MNFLAPGAFLLGLLLPVIVALYLLKLRRIEREIPSNYLWRKMVRDVEANAPWQKLRPNLLMILQLLFLAMLILALARPFSWAEGAGGQATIIILDTSASMAATDVAPNRIESAKQRARQLVNELPGSTRVTIIEAGREARVLLSSSLDRRQAHLAIEQVTAGTGSSDMNVSLELASAIASRQPGTEIIVLSDGRVELPERMAIKGALRYIPFGLNGDNQAVSMLTLEPAPGNASLTAFVQVSNYGDTPASRRLILSVDGQPVNVYDIDEIPAGGQKNVIEEGLPAETRLVEASFEAADTLALDDRAYAVRPDTRPVPVTLVSQGNLFIETALSLLPGIELTTQGGAAADAETEPGEATAEPTTSPVEQESAAGATALWIFDNTVPDQLPTSGSMLFIAPPRSTDLFNVIGAVEAPTPRIVDPTDPLVSNLTLNQVSILDAVEIGLPEWATPVVAGELANGNTPLLFRGEVNGQRVVVLSFDIRHSDLPLQVAFPLMWANMVDWLAPGARNSVPALVDPNSSLTFNAPDGAQTAAIVRPDGSTVQLQAENGRFTFADTTQLGEYLVNFPPAEGEAEGQQAAFAVNLFSPRESNLEPADNLPGLEAQTSQTGTGPQLSMREWWRPLALLALGLLIGEWLVYQRAALARLRDMLLQAPSANLRKTAGDKRLQKGKR